ncbi:hypothetical protein LVJ82_12915 [Vitreoscilla massiliensis]|uniref:DUF4870 domain-containing protein n=1 Tax=Vitreoscilla massiliensis TaxID=1689272 RepID=A0ABY4DZE5_9NEIS|nr:hypothetical protein [Vitreoscilla massiliensis]UOO88369.1 hypothetical protein LVJ82_12915 [Vitreoscilla massiliensis]
MSESEQNPQSPAPSEETAAVQATAAPTHSPIKPSSGGTDLRQYTMIIYILYMVAILVGITSIVGVIMAYVKRADFAGTEYEDHITYLIRTFWISLIGYVIGAVLSVIGIGLIIIIAVGIWYIYRSIAGFIKFNDNKPINALGWM